MRTIIAPIWMQCCDPVREPFSSEGVPIEPRTRRRHSRKLRADPVWFLWIAAVRAIWYDISYIILLDFLIPFMLYTSRSSNHWHWQPRCERLSSTFNTLYGLIFLASFLNVRLVVIFGSLCLIWNGCIYSQIQIQHVSEFRDQ